MGGRGQTGAAFHPGVAGHSTPRLTHTHTHTYTCPRTHTRANCNALHRATQVGGKLLNHSMFRGLLGGEFAKLDDWGLVSARWVGGGGWLRGCGRGRVVTNAKRKPARVRVCVCVCVYVRACVRACVYVYWGGCKGVDEGGSEFCGLAGGLCVPCCWSQQLFRAREGPLRAQPTTPGGTERPGAPHLASTCPASPPACPIPTTCPTT